MIHQIAFQRSQIVTDVWKSHGLSGHIPFLNHLYLFKNQLISSLTLAKPRKNVARSEDPNSGLAHLERPQIIHESLTIK